MKIDYGYSPNRAGEDKLKDVVAKKKELRSRLVKPLEYLYTERAEYVAAFESYIEARVAISRMDYREIVEALKP